MASQGKPQLTPDQRTEIVRLRLEGHNETQVARMVGCARDSVRRWWHAYLEETGQDRRTHLERWQTELAVRQMGVADRARETFRALTQGDMPDWSTARGYLAEERQALREAARVTGLDVVTLHAVAETPLAAATDQDVSEAVGKLPASTLQRFGLVVSTN